MRHFSFSTAIFFLALVVPRTMNADTIYDIKNYPAVQNDHTVSGSITTDGNVGLLTTDDIKSWTVTFDGGTRDAYTFSSTTLGANVALAGVQATSTSITLLAPTSDPGDNLLTLSAGGGQPAFNWLEWSRSGTEDVPDLYWALGKNGLVLWRTTGPQTDPTIAWLIATAQPVAIPEPASLWMLGIACSAGLAYAWRRRRAGRS